MRSPVISGLIALVNGRVAAEEASAARSPARPTHFSNVPMLLKLGRSFFNAFMEGHSSTRLAQRPLASRPDCERLMADYYRQYRVTML